MRVIDASYEILTPINRIEILKSIELAARVCYKSEDKITSSKDSASRFVKMLIKNGHEAMIEHTPSISIKFICDRGISHEIVRHRLASFAMESTRYCNYSNDKFSNEITVIYPCFFKDGEKEMGNKYYVWLNAMKQAEKNYLMLLNLGCSPQEARSVLPTSTKTELIVTMNMRELRHFLRLRTAVDAHPQMRELTIPLLRDLQLQLPELFDDIKQ